MAMVSGQRSTLNPNAPLFIPVAYRKVEDFSPEWWDLVKSCAWFREFWLSELPEGRFDGSGEDKEEDNDDDIMDLLPEDFDIGTGEDLADLDARMEDLVMLAGVDGRVGSIKTTGSKIERNPKMEVKALLKEVSAPKSPRETSPRLASTGPAKYQMKTPPHCVSPRNAHLRIHQPR